MNSEISNKTRINIEIENALYPLVSLLKQTDKSKVEIIIEIERFKERNKEFMFGLDKNYIENYLNKMYAKRNNGEILIEIEEAKIEEER